MKESICETERRKLDKMSRFQLSNQFKKVGWTIVLFTFLIMIGRKIMDDYEWLKPFLKVLLVIGMLIVSISKDKIEDELIDKLRSQSYRLAFIIGVVYYLIQPYVEYGVATILNKDKVDLDFSAFQVLIFMLLVQIMFFENLKRTR